MVKLFIQYWTESEPLQLRRKPPAHGVLAHGSRFDELQQIIAPARFGTHARHAEAAEGLAGHQRAGAAHPKEILLLAVEGRHLKVQRLHPGRSGERCAAPRVAALLQLRARGDRRLADSIEHAYRAGARFDGWDEYLKSELWNRAFEATAIDPAWYAHRERPYDEVLPWAHLHGGADNEYLKRQYDDVFTAIGLPGPAQLIA